MAIPSNRDQHKDWCLRQLGHPVININVDDDQVDDCVDASLQYFQDFHFDGVERWYLKHEITSEDIANQYIPITENIIGVTRIFPISSTNASVNMFDLRYQLRLHELYDFTSTSYVNYVLTMQHIRTLDMMFSGEQPIRFNRHTDKLYLDMNWGQETKTGDWICIWAYAALNPEKYTEIFNDRYLKRYVTALIKRQWGANMAKFDGVALPGGVVMRGGQIYTEAMNEIARIEEDVLRSYELPIDFMTG